MIPPIFPKNDVAENIWLFIYANVLLKKKSVKGTRKIWYLIYNIILFRSACFPQNHLASQFGYTFMNEWAGIFSVSTYVHFIECSVYLVIALIWSFF